MMNIALFQMIVEKDIEDNFNKICKVIEYKLKKNTDIFVLPETALTGYLGFSLERLEKLSSPKIFEYLNIISKLAEKKHIAIVIGQYMKRCGKWYNNLLFFGDDGKCLNSYDKSHLVDYDCFEVCAGNQPKVFEYKGVKMMLGICHDIRYPEHAMVGGDQGVQLLFNPFYGIRTSSDAEQVMKSYDSMIKTRSIENGIYIISPNISNNEQMVRSQICSPSGEIIVKATNFNEQLLYATIDPDLAGYGWVKKRRKDLYCFSNTVKEGSFFQNTYWQKDYYNSNHERLSLNIDKVKRMEGI